MRRSLRISRYTRIVGSEDEHRLTAVGQAALSYLHAHGGFPTGADMWAAGSPGPAGFIACVTSDTTPPTTAIVLRQRFESRPLGYRSSSSNRRPARANHVSALTLSHDPCDRDLEASTAES